MWKHFASFIAVFSLFLLAACGSPTTATSTGTTTPRAGGTPSSNPVTLYYGATDLASGKKIVSAVDGATGKLRWSYAASSDAGIAPPLADGVVILTSNAGMIALNASDGSLRWSNPALAGAGVFGFDKSILYVSRLVSLSSNGGAPTTSLTAVNASDGSVRWSHQLGNDMGEILADGVIYASASYTPSGASANESTLLALSASDGSLKWQSQQESGNLSPFNVAQGLLYVDNSRAHDDPRGFAESIEAHRISDGSLAWKYPSATSAATSLGMDSNILYVSNYGGSAGPFVVALNASTGAVLWQAQTQSDWQSFVAPGMVFLEDGADDTLTALNSADGKQLWQTKLGTPSTSTTVPLVSVGAVTDGVVYLASPDGFTALNASTGAIQWAAHDSLTHDPGGHPIFAIVAGILYSRSDTSIVARSAQSGAVLWSQDVKGPFDGPLFG